MTIRVLSFDFDGCLFHEDYSSNEQNVIKSNKPFLNRIYQENQEFKKVYSLIGSNRQSFSTDYTNAKLNKTGSCFPALQQLSVYLGTSMDTFLLADIFGDLPEGTSFKRATNEDEKEHSPYLFDDTKVTVLYAQIHRIANKHPNEEIIFDFYDDRGNGAHGRRVDLLEQLKSFYGKYPGLIPTNVTLRLHQYAGKEVNPIANGEIKGTGFIDENYKQTVKELSNQAILPGNNGITKAIYVAERAKPELLNNRKPLEVINTFEDNVRKTIHTEAQFQARLTFIDALEEINKKAKELTAESNTLYNSNLLEAQQSADYYSYKRAAKAARLHHQTLLDSAAQFYTDYDIDAFRASTAAAENAAMNSELKNHRGYLKLILVYSGLAVLALLTVATVGLAFGVAYGVGELVGYATNRQNFFSKLSISHNSSISTDSVNKVLDLNDATSELIATVA